MWRELDSKDLDGLAKYANVVLAFFASDEYYEQSSAEYLSQLMTRKAPNMRLFIYDDGKKQMVFGMKYSGSYPNPFTNEDGMWKVVDLAYIGEWGELDSDGVSLGAFKFGQAYIRDLFDKEGITNWYVILHTDITMLDRLVAEKVPQRLIFLKFLDYIDKMMWEKTEEKYFGDNTHMVCHFHRNKDSKPVDEVTWIKPV